MEKCASWNIRGIEIGDALLRENKEEIKELLEKNHMQVSCSNAFYDFGHNPDAAQGKKQIDLAEEFGVSKVLIIPGELSENEASALNALSASKEQTDSYMSENASIQNMAQALKELVSYGQEKGILVTLEDFDGPLDVILLLLSKNKIEIQDIQISAILEQYLAYLDEMKRMDMEIASEFIAMASYLMYIKTRMLLSKAEQEEAQSEMDKLVESLQKRQRQDAYQQIQKAAKQLGARNELGLGLFTKGPEPYQPDQTYRYRHDRADLTAALAAMQDRTERRLPPPVSNFAGIVGTEPYPVTQKAKQVISRLISHGVMRFLALFKGSRSRSEIVATFLAVLELCRLRSVSVGEDENGEPSVTYLKTPDADVQTDIS